MALGPNCTDDGTLTTHAKVFATADKYNISGLKLLAQYKFHGHIAKRKPSPVDLAGAIRTVFNTTPDTITELRKVLKDYLVGVDGDIIDKAEVQDAVESIHGLAFELFKRMKGKVSGSPAKSLWPEVASQSSPMRPVSLH